MKFKPLIFLFICFKSIIAQVDTSAVLDSIVLFDYKATAHTPVTYQDLSASYLLLRNVGQEPSFILSQTPSVTAYSDAGSYQGYAYFRLRGIDQTRINMTLDGVPLNEPEDQGAYFSNYPDFLNSISKIQIQRGVGTTQNGVASYVGSIQFSSPDLRDTTARMRIGSNYGSYRSYRMFGEYITALKKNKAFHVRVSNLHSDGYKYHSGNSSQSAFMSGAWYMKKCMWKVVGFAGLQRNELAWLGVSADSIAIDRKINANTQEKDRFLQNMIQLQNHWFVSSMATIKSTIYYNYLNGNYDFDLNNFLGLASDSTMYNYAFQSHFLGLFSTYNYETRNLNFSTGIHVNTYNRAHVGSEKTLGELYHNKGIKTEQSMFAKAQYKILPSFSALVDVQLRHSSFAYDGSVFLPVQAWTFVNPKAGINYTWNKYVDIYYSIGATQREPTRTDMFGGNDDLLADSTGTKAFTYINAAEQVLDQELGLRYATSKWHLNANLYYMDFKNEIVLNGKFGANGLALNSNVSRSYRTGLELDLGMQINKRLLYQVAASYNQSVIADQGLSFKPILTPRWIMNQDLLITLNNVFVGLELRYQSASYLDFANEHSIGEYLLANVRLGYTYKKAWAFTFRLNNAFDTKYYNSGYVDTAPKYFVQAPINYSLALVFTH